jgi:hypothetical protein
VPIPSVDGEQQSFEIYLKQFRPVASEKLLIENRGRVRNWVFALGGLGAAAALILGALLFGFRSHSEENNPVGGPDHAIVKLLGDPQPQTVGSANALLSHSHSVREALDQVVLHSRSNQIEKGKRSALAVLSENKEKL